jgi:DNA polymerase III gamma/tau subunit
MWQVVGHEQVLAALGGELRDGRAAHAYLFSGLPQVGKATLALELAQALNCDEGVAGVPCGVCRHCERIAGSLHADVERLTPRSPCDVSEHDHAREGVASLRICQVRRIEHLFAQSPFEGRARVVMSTRRRRSRTRPRTPS